MTFEPVLDYDIVSKSIAKWSPTDRLLLAQNILNSLILEQTQGSTPKNTLSQALGLLTTEQPAPTDEQISHWLKEHRLEKYG